MRLPKKREFYCLEQVFLRVFIKEMKTIENKKKNKKNKWFYVNLSYLIVCFKKIFYY